MADDQKFYRLRSGVVMAYTRVIPTGAVRCDADGKTLEDEPVETVDSSPQPIPAALVDQELAETVQPGDLPSGPPLAIIEWVGNDAKRAAQAIQAENERTRPRSSVVKAVQHLTEPTEGA